MASSVVDCSLVLQARSMEGIVNDAQAEHSPARVNAPDGMPARMPESTTTVFMSRSNSDNWSITPASHSSL